MLLAANMSLLEWVLLGTILACGGGVLWRTFASGAAGKSTAHAETEDSERAQARADGRIAHLEVRLHDFAREVEARLETRALQLDSLVVAGDREIVRLSTILNQLELADGGSTRQPDVTHYAEPRPKIATAAQSSPEKSVPPAQVEMVGHLSEAGYSVAEIAQIIGRAPTSSARCSRRRPSAALLRTGTLLRTGHCAPARDSVAPYAGFGAIVTIRSCLSNWATARRRPSGCKSRSRTTVGS